MSVSTKPNRFMDVTYYDLNDLLNYRSSPEITRPPFTVASGYHLYVETRLDQSITAPATKEIAKRYLRFLQRFTWLCAEASGQIGGNLLEAQGSRVHLFIPCSYHNTRSFMQLVELSAFLYASIKRELDKRFREKASGVAAAVDFGEAMMLSSHIADSDSIVSLGECANRPAKRLGHYMGGATSDNVHTKELSFHRELLVDELRPYLDSPDGSGWLEVLLDRINVGAFEHKEWQSAFENSFSAERLREFEFEIRDATANKEVSRLVAESNEAVSFYGWMLRADLDGFSPRVAAAKSTAAKAVLAERFYRLMDHYNDYIIRYNENPPIPMPWAGDCATLILLPRDSGHDSPSPAELYSRSRAFLPVVEMSKWLEEMGESAKDTLNSSWAIGFAGCDPNGASFNILRATLRNGDRQFPIAVGRCVKASSDGENSEWLEGDEVALYCEDYAQLRESFHKIFEPEDSNFYSSTKDQIRHALENADPSSSSSRVFSPRKSPTVVLPPARPYASEF